MPQPKTRILISQRQINQRIAKLILVLVKDKQIGSYRALARLTGVEFNTLNKWSNLLSEPKLDKLTDFAYGLELSMSELMEFAEGDEDPHHVVARIKKRHQFKSSPQKKSNLGLNPSKTLRELVAIAS